MNKIQIPRRKEDMFAGVDPYGDYVDLIMLLSFFPGCAYRYGGHVGYFSSIFLKDNISNFQVGGFRLLSLDYKK